MLGMADASVPAFGVPQGFKADRAQVAAVKARLLEAGVKSCFATFVDVYGIPKSKLTPIDAFEHMCDGSELYTVGAVEGLGLAGPQEDECATVPDLKSGVVLPWDKSRAWFASDLWYHGEPYAGDPRGILRRVLARAEKLAPWSAAPKFFHGLGMLRSGQRDVALAEWRALLASAPAEAEWRPLVEDGVAMLERQAGS